MYRIHSQCRACNLGALGANGSKAGPQQKSLIKVADFGVMPLANDFQRAGDEYAGFAPLEVMLCPRCHLAQLSVVVDPKILYTNYPYVTSGSQTMRTHFETILAQMTERLGKLPESILEIGSNDGKFLQLAKEHGVKEIHGIEPDAKLAQVAAENGVPTTVKFWPNNVYAFGVKYDIILARHVFAHVDDWHGFVAKAREFMHENSILWIEAPWVETLLRHHQADTIYHEHLSYINIDAIHALLVGTDLRLANVLHYDLHGGCLGLLIQFQRKDMAPLATEGEGFLNPERWKALEQKAWSTALKLGNEVRTLTSKGKRVVGYGASAKSSFWVQLCKFRRGDLAFITDDTKAKWFTTSPGTDIPILDEGALLREMPDYAVLFAWNYLPEVIRKNEFWISKGGRFIVPVPELHFAP